jgi:hypothetical protein
MFLRWRAPRLTKRLRVRCSKWRGRVQSFTEFLGFLLGIVGALALRFIRHCCCSSERSTHSYVFWCPATRAAFFDNAHQPNEAEIAPGEVDPVENQPADQNGATRHPAATASVVSRLGRKVGWVAIFVAQPLNRTVPASPTLQSSCPPMPKPARVAFAFFRGHCAAALAAQLNTC